MTMNTLEGTVKKTETCSFQHCPVRGPEAHWKTGSSLRTSETVLGQVAVLEQVEVLGRAVMESPSQKIFKSHLETVHHMG